MSTWVGIEQLTLSRARPSGALPKVSPKLMGLIRDHGQVEPVVVRPTGAERFEILSNAETWLAVQRAGCHKVLIDVRDDLDDDAAADVVKRSSGSDKENPIENANRLALRIEELGGRGKRGVITTVASEEGCSRSNVSHALRLLELPKRIQQWIVEGQLSPGHARPLVTLSDRKKQLRLAEGVITKGLSVRETEQLVRKKHGAMQSANRQTHDSDPDTRQLENRITETIGCQTRIDIEAGQLVIDYTGNLDVLDGVLTRLGCLEEQL